VDALTRCIGGEQDLHVWIVPERFLRFQPLLASHAAVDDDDGFWTSQQRAHIGMEITQGVTVLRENDELLTRGGGGRWDSDSPIGGGLFCHLSGDGSGGKNDAEQARQLTPLAVLAAAAHSAGECFEASEGRDLGLQFVDGAGS